MSRTHTLARFKEPTARDEIYECYGCSEMFHFTELDKDGRCKDCRPEKPVSNCCGDYMTGNICNHCKKENVE